MEVRDRFMLFLKAMKTTQRDFAKVANYRHQSLSKFVTGETKSPKIDLFIILAKHYPTLNLRWLLLGEGEMLGNPNASENQQILKQFKEVNDLKDQLLQSQQALVHAQKEIIALKDQLLNHRQSE